MNVYLLRSVALGLNKEKPKETTLEIYQQCFEDEFIAATELYYTAESSTFIEANSVADYMKKVHPPRLTMANEFIQVETRLAEEVQRVRAYLHPSSEADLVSKCDRVLIEKHVETIWNEFQNLLQDDKLEGNATAVLHALLSEANKNRRPHPHVVSVESDSQRLGSAANHSREARADRR